jgi:pseudaminic acid synthase
MNRITIDGRNIGNQDPVFFIAEISANHNGDLRRAMELIRTARECGADAVKIQTYTPDTMTLNSGDDYFRIKDGPWKGQTLYELYQKAQTPWEWHPQLFDFARKEGILLFSSPFDSTAVDFLSNLGMQAYKIASPELIDIPLIRAIAQRKKPVFLSTGMGTLDEIDRAVLAIRETGNNEIIILKCTSTYPARVEEMNLSGIPYLRERFGTIIGLSDHSMEKDVVLAAVVLGAKVIEKHITLSRKDEGPDTHFSLEPDEWREMVRSVRNIEKAFGRPEFGPAPGEKENLKYRRSLFIVKDMNKGEVFTEKNLRSVRPAYGLEPRFYPLILGKKASRAIKSGTPMESSLVEGGMDGVE